MSRPYAEVIGDPIAHSKSPAIHGFWLGRLGIEADYRACHVKPDELGGYFASRRADPDWRGCNVTIPHKQAVLPFIDQLDARARRVGAVNTIWKDDAGRLCATNTDVDGVRDAIAGMPAGHCRAVVIGAGGAARAAFALLAERADYDVTVVARSPDKAQPAVADCGLVAGIVPFAQGPQALHGATLVINATQLGMTGQATMPDELIAALGTTAPGALVFDMVYAPLETELLAGARAQGLRTSDGLVMLIGQAATAFERFFKARPPREADTDLRRILTA